MVFRPRKRPWTPYDHLCPHVNMTALISKARRYMSYVIDTCRETIKKLVTQLEQTCTAV